jgi:hypothetical protein
MLSMVNSLLSNLYGKWSLLFARNCQLHEETPTETKYKVKTHFCFISFLAAFLADTGLMDEKFGIPKLEHYRIFNKHLL